MNAQQQINHREVQENIEAERQISREKFAEGLVMDLKQFGEAEYFIDGEKEFFRMKDVVEHMSCDIDGPAEFFYRNPGDEVAVQRFHNALNEAALGLANLLAERAVK